VAGVVVPQDAGAPAAPVVGSTAAGPDAFGSGFYNNRDAAYALHLGGTGATVTVSTCHPGTDAR